MYDSEVMECSYLCILFYFVQEQYCVGFPVGVQSAQKLPQILELETVQQAEKKIQIQIKYLIYVTDWILQEADSETDL